MVHAERRQDSAVCVTGASGEWTSVPTAVANTRGQLLDVIVGLPALGEFQPDLLGCMHDGRMVPATECLPYFGQRQVGELTAQVHRDLPGRRDLFGLHRPAQLVQTDGEVLGRD